jgi:NhaP-type Na+/H+ or K+/H+ antiporter
LHSPATYLAGVLALGIAAQWVAWRLRIPSILLLLLVGVVTGLFVNPDVVLGTEIVQPIVSLSVALVLFEGGLTLRLSDLTETRAVVLRLMTIGALITWGLATAAGLLVFDDVRVALLAGAIYTVTGPTVIGPMLRSIRPNRSVGSVAKWEGIVVDPIGALLAVLVFEAVVAVGAEAAAASVVWGIVETIAVAVPLAAVSAGLFVLVLRRHWLPDHLQVPAMLATVLLVHTLSNLVQHESGLATVTLLGMLLANQKFAKVGHVLEFKEHLSVLLISTLFILLASRLDPWSIVALGPGGLIFLVLLIVVIRPLSVFGALAGTSMKMPERAFLAWLAPRGIVAVAVSSVFTLHTRHLAESPHATEAKALLPQMESLVALTFLVVVGTVTVYGLTAGPVARRLGVAEPDPQGVLFLGANRISTTLATALREAGFQVLLVDTNREHVRAARMEGLAVVHGNALRETVKENLNLGGIGRLLATSPNDEVNTLAALDYVEVFGRSEVYQLVERPEESRVTEQQAVAGNGAEHQPAKAERYRGRGLFAGDLDFRTLVARLDAGSTIKRTHLTEEFGFDRFRELYGETARVLFVLQASGELAIVTSANGVAPKQGQTVIALVDPVEPIDVAVARAALDDANQSGTVSLE